MEAIYGRRVDGILHLGRVGGKTSEQRILGCWFGEGQIAEFCGMKVTCPSNYDAYLTRIYGKNYLEKNPAAERIAADKKVEISASYIDFGEGKAIGHKTS